ncbi:unnamed protein product [Menidia menidia]|uniref:Ubiquitin carboxyl-terminal hydrolase n=1 Tax=Menidia menidia TaxID=238744 RepID=A0A8S4ABW6_9TELE|nr:unnamed protein product [Menidia menidia]
MRTRSLSVGECAWSPEECRPVEELPGAPQRDSLRLPNIFKSRRVKPLGQPRPSPACPVHRTPRELLLEVLDREAVRELLGRAPGRDLSEEQYGEALMWFSIVLGGGLSAGRNGHLGPEPTPRPDRCRGILKRNGIQSSLLSLTKLEDGQKLAALTSFSDRLCKRFGTLHSPGPELTVKKYKLSHHSGPCPLSLALLCDVRSGFICNVLLYCPEQLRTQGRRPVVEQVVRRLLGPFRGRTLKVQLDSSAWAGSGLPNTLPEFGANISLVPAVKRPVKSQTTSSPQNHDLKPRPPVHLQGWTGPALLLPPDPRGSAADVFLPGLWAALHVAFINTFVLHALQSRGPGRTVQLAEFSRALAAQLPADSGGGGVPLLPRLNSSSFPETGATNQPKHRVKAHSCAGLTGLERRSNRPGVCGLDNSGNSCYLNAVLQCLCSTVPLVEHLLSQDTRRELAKSRCRVTEAFVRLLEKMWLGGGSSCAPLEARAALGSVLPQFNNFSQQDAQELLLFLLNALQDDFKKVLKRSWMQRPRREPNRSLASESTVVTRLFEGRLSYATLCMHCDQQALNTQTFTVLSLPIPKDIPKCSIQDCLSLFFEQTVLTGGEQVLCSECGLRRETTVLTSLEKAPEILVLHLKRFGCKGRNQVKLRTNVSFSMKLDLTPFLSSSVHNTSSSYHLYAVVNHTGNLNMGHYTAACFSAPAQRWHCFDDAEVRELEEILVQSPNAYMLLYSHKPFQKPQILGL